MIPKIAEHKITILTKPGGKKQYLITLPKEYAENLEKIGIKNLFIIYDKGLGVFPKVEGFTEKALLAFMQEHPELEKLFIQTAEKEAPQHE
jgi:trehalose/maltose hydrolase-like predicted phosphorylase